MAIRKTLQIGDKKLVAKNSSVSDPTISKIKELVEDLTDTMRGGNLIGIAAPKIGENLQIFISEPRKTPTRSADQSDELRVYINPKIIELSDESVEMYEGCGSFAEAKLFAPVIRSKVVTIEATDLNVKRFRLKADGILGRVILHEFDHLLGVQFIELVSDYSRILALEHYREFVKTAPQLFESWVINIKESTYI